MRLALTTLLTAALLAIVMAGLGVAAAHAETAANVLIGDCDSGVADRDVEGVPLQTIIDLSIEGCLAEAVHPGDFTACFSHDLNDLRKAGVLTGREASRLLTCAVHARLLGQGDGNADKPEDKPEHEHLDNRDGDRKPKK